MVDHVKNNKDGFTLRQLLDLMGAVDIQPDWRSPASIACAYYDGDQLSDTIRNVLRERGQPEIVHNMIGPTIDGVLGMEARTRNDLLVSADDDEGEELAQAINEEFKDNPILWDQRVDTTIHYTVRSHSKTNMYDNF